MVETESMTIEELEAYISTLPSGSPCSRAYTEKLQADLNLKKHIANLEGNV